MEFTIEIRSKPQVTLLSVVFIFVVLWFPFHFWTTENLLLRNIGFLGRLSLMKSPAGPEPLLASHVRAEDRAATRKKVLAGRSLQFRQVFKGIKPADLTLRRAWLFM